MKHSEAASATTSRRAPPSKGEKDGNAQKEGCFFFLFINLNLIMLVIRLNFFSVVQLKREENLFESFFKLF